MQLIQNHKHTTVARIIDAITHTVKSKFLITELAKL
jgi:hypothetical protein